MRRALRRSGAAVVILVVMACGVPSDDEPTVAARDRVPYGLLETARSTTSTTARASRPVEVFFVRNGALVPVTRRPAEPVTLERVIAELLRGPAADEVELGIRSALTSREVVQDVTVSRGIARVSLSSRFTEAQADEQTLALAQIVYTATALPGVGAVQFLLGEEAVQVPRPDGTLSAAPVARDDFVALTVAP